MAWAQVEEQEAKMLGWDNQLGEAAEKHRGYKGRESQND